MRWYSNWGGFLFLFSFFCFCQVGRKIKRVLFPSCTELVPTYNKYRSMITANHLQFLLSLRVKSRNMMVLYGTNTQVDKYMQYRPNENQMKVVIQFQGNRSPFFFFFSFFLFSFLEGQRGNSRKSNLDKTLGDGDRGTDQSSGCTT